MKIEVRKYTKELIQDVIDFEERLRKEENFWGWEIDEAYIESVKRSFDDIEFNASISLLAYVEDKVVGRIDSSMIASHFDGSKKAYLDWICVIKSYRHSGVAQRLLSELLQCLQEKNIETLIALTAANDEAQKFYKSIPNSEMKDIGIWIDVK
ncbi:MAG: GNAT family N-acetyltransferase [Lachnospiraceae bacterium]|nr:GNAT family N-acetyltransferase [Lachnospiraceae bacterium]